MRNKIVGLSGLLFVLLSRSALAHGSDSNAAPDMHPLLVALEFAVIALLGYKLAKWLSGIGR